MKYLIMCEGPNELEIIKILLKHDCLKLTEDDLLGLVPYHARQIKSSGVVQTALNIKEYRRVKGHAKDEHYLAELLK
jgi:hypothetical protein